MDDKTEILISLGASTAANCVPCFEYYFEKATKLGLNMEDIKKAVEIGNKVKTGSSIAMTKSIRSITNSDTEPEGGDGAATTIHPCCH
jgi:alkylhydroperoxidase/carboxymuconolactone decarboxylase family protein YurZ